MSGEIWALSDGAAGNRRQARALAEALAETLGGGPLREWILRPRAPWRWLAPRRLPGVARAFGAEFAAALSQPPPLAVGCGRQSALATRLLREHGGRVVQILDPRLPPRHWDALVVPAHDRVRGDNVLTTLGSLHAVDEASLEAGRRAFPELGDLPAPRTVLLLGGPIRGIRLNRAWWAHLSGILEHWLARDRGSLLVSGSRRTPAWLVRAVRERFGQAPGRLWFGDADGANPYAGFLGWGSRIVVSPDSVNLISEASATAVPVFVAGDPRGRAPRGRHGRFLRALVEAGRIRPLRLEAANWPVTPLRELPGLAAALRARLLP